MAYYLLMASFCLCVLVIIIKVYEEIFSRDWWEAKPTGAFEKYLRRRKIFGNFLYGILTILLFLLSVVTIFYAFVFIDQMFRSIHGFLFCRSGCEASLKFSEAMYNLGVASLFGVMAWAAFEAQQKIDEYRNLSSELLFKIQSDREKYKKLQEKIKSPFYIWLKVGEGSLRNSFIVFGFLPAILFLLIGAYFKEHYSLVGLCYNWTIPFHSVIFGLACIVTFTYIFDLVFHSGKTLPNFKVKQEVLSFLSTLLWYIIGIGLLCLFSIVYYIADFNAFC